MQHRTWLITGVSSGFGRELTGQLLARGDRVVGTVRDTAKVTELIERYPDTFRAEVLDVTDTAAVRVVVDRSFAALGRIDVVISNAGYGLFGAAEELTDQQVDHMIATNLTGAIQLIRSALPHLRAQGGGRIIQISSYGGQVAFPGNSMYHATRARRPGPHGRAHHRERRDRARAAAAPARIPGAGEPRSPRCATASPASRRRPSSPPRPTSRRANHDRTPRPAITSRSPEIPRCRHRPASGRRCRSRPCRPDRPRTTGSRTGRRAARPRA